MTWTVKQKMPCTNEPIDYDDDVARNIVVYGTGPDAAVFSTRCPKCGRFTRAADTAKRGFDEIMHAHGNCRRCGVVHLEFVCWADDNCGV